MASQKSTVHETWSSQFTFVMAAVGSAVGLGNFWRFPYEAGQNGGAVFVVVYLVAVLAIAFPVLIAEYAIGRRTGLSAVGATVALAKDSNRSPLWGAVGWIGMIAGFLILTYYSVIAGWVMAYVPIFLSGELTNVGFEGAQVLFSDLNTNTSWALGWHTAFMGLTAFIVARGLKGGIEVAANILMPMFFVMVVAMVIYGAYVGDVAAAATFLFSPDFSKISFDVVVSAIGQAFFSVGVGSAIMITYGAYMTRDEPIAGSARTVALSDTFIAILAGFAIFPMVFVVQGLEPNAGPGLLFATLPAAIGELPYGSLVGGVFFTLAFFAALTSSISLFEVIIAWSEDQLGWQRGQAALRWGLIAWFIGIGSLLSFGVWSGFYPLDFGPFAGQTFFGVLDVLTGNIMLPLSGLAVSLFAGWAVSESIMREEIGLSPLFFQIWQVLTRYVIPVAIIVVLIASNLSWILPG